LANCLSGDLFKSRKAGRIQAKKSGISTTSAPENLFTNLPKTMVVPIEEYLAVAQLQ